MTDLDRFRALLDSVGATYEVTESRNLNPKVIDPDLFRLGLKENGYTEIVMRNTHTKHTGYSMFYTTITFTLVGDFLAFGSWE